MILIGHDGHLGNSFIIGTTIFKCRINFFQMIFIFYDERKKTLPATTTAVCSKQATLLQSAFYSASSRLHSRRKAGAVGSDAKEMQFSEAVRSILGR